MAVVFISPKKRQGIFFTIITAIFILFVAIIFVEVFFPKSITVTSVPAVGLSKTNIDMSIFNSPQFKALQPFHDINISGNKPGRGNPFVPYYQVPTPTPTPMPKLVPIKTTK